MNILVLLIEYKNEWVNFCNKYIIYILLIMIILIFLIKVEVC